MIRSLNVPLVDFVTRDLDTALEMDGARFCVDTVNWPAQYPYAPICNGPLARTADALVVDFRVSGLDLRIQNLTDNGRQWEDSCVEFFVQDPDGSVYYNFEINPLGKVLACSGPDRHHRTPRPPEEMEQILRIADYSECPMDCEGGVWTWRVVLLIPFHLIGVNPEHLPAALKANFYKCGDHTAHPHYVSWSPIDTPEPDFHRPECFGTLHLL